MNQVLYVLIMACTAVVLTGCQQRTLNGQQVIFIEQEPGVDPYETRMLVTTDSLRIDDGAESSGYVIFDRKKKIIYSVNDPNRTVMIIDPKPSELRPPLALTHTIKELGELKDAPKINNTTPVHRQFLTNNELCMDVISVAGLLPDMVKAMDEYQNVLATDSAGTFYNLPADMHKPCDMAISIFAPARQFRHGFPLREWRPGGFSRSLHDYKESVAVTAALFAVPADYFTYSVQQFRDGQVDMNNRRVITAPASLAAPAAEQVTGY